MEEIMREYVTYVTIELALGGGADSEAKKHMENFEEIWNTVGQRGFVERKEKDREGEKNEMEERVRLERNTAIVIIKTEKKEDVLMMEQADFKGIRALMECMDRKGALGRVLSRRMEFSNG